MQNLLSTQQTLSYRLLQSIRQYGSEYENYYDILKVSKSCSNKDIRDAFVKLTKEFHPDVKGAQPDPEQTTQFVKISEAYQILSKPKLRSAYDQDLWAKGIAATQRTAASGGLHTTEVHRPWEIKPNFDPNPGPYYGIKGLEKLSNTKIALALIALGIFGAVFGYVSVKHSATFNRQQLDEKSAEASSHHATVRANAEKFGNKEQLRRMVNRMAQE